MKKRIFSMAMALVMTLALAAPVFAEEEEAAPAPEYRLTSITQDGDALSTARTYTFSYGQGGWLPTEITSSEEGTVVTATYDDAGRVISLVNPLETVTYEYDDSGNLLMQSSHRDSTDSDGNLTTYDDSSVYTYDENGNRIHKETTSGYDGELSTTISEYTYDDAGNCLHSETTYEDGSVNTTEYAYDDAGNLLSSETTRSDGAVSTMEYTYDEQGNLLRSESVQDGEITSAFEYTYDDKGREIQEDFTIGSYSQSIKFVYTPLLTLDYYTEDNYVYVVCSLYDSTGTEDILYQVLPNVRYTGEPQFTYDDNGNVTQIDFDDGSIVFTYEPVA